MLLVALVKAMCESTFIKSRCYAQFRVDDRDCAVTDTILTIFLKIKLP